MSQVSRGIFGTIAISLALGAVAFAAGRDLSGGARDAAGTSEAAINRAAKADREAGAAISPVATQTISIRLGGFSDASFLVRIPADRAARNSFSALPLTKSFDRKVTVACEPVVSILTEVASQLQPGRCIT
jgi:hypothetical protein